MLIDLAKKALPVLAAMYGSKLIANKVGPMIPGLSALGSYQAPAVAVGTVVGIHFLTKKVGALAKYRNELLLGSAIAALDSVLGATGLKSMLGMGDIYDQAMGEYVQMGEYVGVGEYLDDDIAMADYIQVGSVEEELGAVQEELGMGVEEELGNDLLGGVSQSSLMKTVPERSFLEPVPARSFTKPVRNAGPGYDNAGTLYQGIFRGGLFG